MNFVLVIYPSGFAEFVVPGDSGQDPGQRFSVGDLGRKPYLVPGTSVRIAGRENEIGLIAPQIMRV